MQGCRLIMLHPKQEILASMQALVNEPILSAHSETELMLILKQIDAANATETGTELEINNPLDSISKSRTLVIETDSTNL